MLAKKADVTPSGLHAVRHHKNESCRRYHLHKASSRSILDMIRAWNLIGISKCLRGSSVMKAVTAVITNKARNVHSSIRSSASKAPALPDLTLPTYVYEGYPLHKNTNIHVIQASSSYICSQLFAGGFVFDKVRYKSEQGCER